MENDKIKKTMKTMKLNSKRQSAGVNAPQRINAKELWYILGFIEADGSFSCYKEKDHIRAEMSIGLHENDIKLLYWIRSQLGVGQIKKIKHSNPKYLNKLVARYIIRSKIFIEKNFLLWYHSYPPLTQNKKIRIKYVENCLNQNKILSKNFNISTTNQNTTPLVYDNIYPDNLNVYFKDWIIGFIEGDGSFYFVERKDKRIAEFNIVQKGEKGLLTMIGKEMNLSQKNKISTKENGACILTAVSLKDIQAVINFMFDPERIRLKGLKKVKFLLWISELRVNPRYSGLKIPFKY